MAFVASCNDRMAGNMGPAAEAVDTRATLPLNLSEDTGESVKRNTLSHSTVVKKDGTDLAGTIPSNIEPTFSQPKAAASNAGLKASSSSAPVERQKEKNSFNAIDDLFQGLD